MEIEYKALADDILNFYGLVLCFQNFSFLLLPWLYYSVIIWVLYIYLWILFFILILSIVRLTIILFMIELLKERFKFGLSLIKINYVMFFLKNLFLMLYLPIYGHSFVWSPHLQLKEAYYGILEFPLYLYFYLV